ncbi:MAG: hypothetical protein AB7F66_10185 [Bacteriovoracia bacterium]
MSEDKKLIDRLWVLIVAVATVGPFALPLLWRNPHYKLSTKIGASVLVVALTVYLLYFSAGLMQQLAEQLQALQQMQNQN